MENNIPEEIINFSKQESQAIDEYIKNIYSKKVPEPMPPTKKELSFWKIAGIEATLFTLASVGVIGFSSIRTGGFFFIVEQLILKEFKMANFVTDAFSFASMAFSLMAFELYVAGDGFSKGKDNRGIKRSKIGVWASLIVIVLAGMFTGMGLVEVPDNIRTYFYLGVAMITAIAGGVVAFYSGENVGFTFSKVERLREEALANHQSKYLKWRETAVKSYLSSHYNVHKNVQQPSKVNVQAIHVPDKKGSKLETAYEFVKEYHRINGKLPTARDVEKGVGVSVGTGFSAISKFSKEISSKESETKAKPISEYIEEFIGTNFRYPTPKEVADLTGEIENTVIRDMLEYAVINENELVSKNILSQEQMSKVHEEFQKINS